MSTPSTAADDHREIAGRFTAVVRGTEPARWDDPAPVEGWVARDVVRHLVGWLPAFLSGSAGIDLPPGPSVDDDPVAAWTTLVGAVQGLLDDPASAARPVTNEYIGEMTVENAIAMIWTNDVFMHTWDLARATGQDETLDPERCARMYEGMLPMDEMLRAGGQYGPRVEVPDDADPQTKLLGFIGRRV